MRFVSLKSEAQFDLQVLHRARERLVLARTAVINQLRAVPLERGIVFPKGRVLLMRRLEAIGTANLAVGARTRTLVKDLIEECAEFDRRVGAYEEEFATVARDDAQARRLSSIPGVGVINATALLAAVGDGSAFARGSAP